MTDHSYTPPHLFMDLPPTNLDTTTDWDTYLIFHKRYNLTPTLYLKYLEIYHNLILSTSAENLRCNGISLSILNNLSFPNLKTITLSNCNGSLSSLSSIHLPSLLYLNIVNPSIDTPIELSDISDCFFPTIQTLSVQGYFYSSGTLNIPKLTCLILLNSIPYDIHHLHRSSLPELTQLYLHIPYLNGLPISNITDLSLSNFPLLQFLSISATESTPLSMDGHIPDTLESLHFEDIFPSLTYSVTLPNLKRLKLILPSLTPSIIAFLTKLKTPNLIRIVILIPSGKNSAYIQDICKLYDPSQVSIWYRIPRN